MYDQFVTISEKYNVPFVSSIQINSTIPDWNGLYLQNDLNWEICVHPDCGQEGGLANLETEEEIEQWMIDTIDYLDAHGYKWKNVVYAHGEPDERVRRIAKKYFRCGVCGSKPMLNKNVIANFEIQRIPIGYPMGAEWNTFEHLKTFIDDAVTNNAWCIFMTHAGMAAHTDAITNLIDQLIDYAVNTLNIDILTLNEGFNIFGNALECGDYLGRNHTDYPISNDPTTGVAISQTGELGNIINTKSITNLLNTLNTILNGTFTMTYDENTGAYVYTFTPNNS